METMEQSTDMSPESAPAPDESENIHGIKIAFELLDHEEKLVKLDDFLGKHVLLTFGFTHCAHICPILAANMARAFKKERTNNAVGIFISIDTERDTPVITHEFAQGFHRKLIGLSGNYEQINIAANNFKVSYSVTKTQRHYTAQHTTNIFHIDPEGNLVDIYTMNTLPETMSKAMD